MSGVGESITQFIIEQQRAHNNSTGEMSGLLNDIASACKKISHLVNRSAIIGIGGAADSENVQGEKQKRLDIITNEVMVDHLIGRVTLLPWFRKKSFKFPPADI